MKDDHSQNSFVNDVNERYGKNPLLSITLDFSVGIVEYAEQLEAKKKFVIAQQILKSGTSIGANSRESQNAESKVHFISKLKTALREADELEYWFLICDRCKSYPNVPSELWDKLSSILKIINKIISTTKRNHL